MIPYKTALQESRKVGASHATGDAERAQSCKALAHAYGLDPNTLYVWASCRGLTGNEVGKSIIQQWEPNMGSDLEENHD